MTVVQFPSIVFLSGDSQFSLFEVQGWNRMRHD